MTTREPRKRARGTDSRTATRAFRVLGNRLTVLADHEKTGGRYDLIGGRQNPGNRTPPHLHTSYDERLYVMDGEPKVWADERTVVLRSGDTFAISASEVQLEKNRRERSGKDQTR